MPEKVKRIDRLKEKRESVLLETLQYYREQFSLTKGRLIPVYQTMQYCRQEYGWEIAWMCRYFQISRSGYYQWLRRVPSQQEKDNQLLIAWIREYDEKHRHLLGYRRMCSYINRDKGTHFGKERVRKMMRLLGIQSVIRRPGNSYKTPKTYTASIPQITAENILNRKFEAYAPNEKWSIDVTELTVPSDHRKLYLCAVLDLYDRSIVAYRISKYQDDNLIYDTCKTALRSNPGVCPILHTDRGEIYTSREFQVFLKNTHMTASMSRAGCVLDNGPMEGFWGILKAEMLYVTSFKNVEEIPCAVSRYMDYYNYFRYQQRYENQTPMEVRRAAFEAEVPRFYPIKRKQPMVI